MWNSTSIESPCPPLISFFHFHQILSLLSLVVIFGYGTRRLHVLWEGRKGMSVSEDDSCKIWCKELWTEFPWEVTFFLAIIIDTIEKKRLDFLSSTSFLTRQQNKTFSVRTIIMMWTPVDGSILWLSWDRLKVLLPKRKDLVCHIHFFRCFGNYIASDIIPSYVVVQ